MSRSIKKNYLLNLINTILGIIFPIITFPYASRILMADGIGQVDFLNSIISYITLFSALGIPMYAIREVARVRDDIKQLSITTTEIIVLHTLLTFIGYVVVGIICMTLAGVRQNIPLFLMLSSSMILSTIGVNWFYQGVEDFAYITFRNIIVKIVTIILLFMFVHEKSDILWYALTIVVGNVGNNVFNFFRLKKYISLNDIYFFNIHPFHHLKPALRIFVLNIIVSIYTQLDIVMLGFMQSPTCVGYFSASTKITTIILTLATSLGTVILPRLSNLIANNNMIEFARLSQKAVDFIFLTSMPLFLGIIVTAGPIINLFCGNTFGPSVDCLQIISPIVLFIALSNVIGIQILYPQGKENIVIYSTIVGACLNVILNIILIPKFAQNGAAISTVFAEVGVTLTQIIIGLKYVPVKFFSKSTILVLISSLIMFIICIYINGRVTANVYKLIYVTFIGAFIYISLIMLFRIPIAFELYHIIKNKILSSIK